MNDPSIDALVWAARPLLIAQTRQVLDPAIGVALAVEGFVEATKTVPLRGGAPAGDKP
jgi:hypothetical protein